MHSKIRKLVSESRVDEVFPLLKTVLVDQNSPLTNDLILIEAKYKSNRQQFGQGVISDSDYNLESAKIRKALLELSDEVNSSGLFEVSKNIEEQSHGSIKAYVERLETSCIQFPLLTIDFDNQVKTTLHKIEDIYIEPKLLNVNSTYERSEDIDTMYGVDEISTFDKGSNKNNSTDFKEVIEAKNRVVILGDPGLGKTSMIKYQVASLCKSYIKKFDEDSGDRPFIFPLFFRCRDINIDKFPKSLTDVILQCLYFCSIDSNPSISQCLSYIKNEFLLGNVCLFVDGLDEIEDEYHRNLFCDLIQRISNNFNRCKFVISSRVYGFKSISHRIDSSFHHYRIAFYDEKKISNLIDNISKALLLPRRIDIENFKYEVFNNKSLLAFKTPFLISNLFVIYASEKKMPKNVSMLFHLSISLLFKKTSLSHKAKIDYNRDTASFLAYIARSLTMKGQSRIDDRTFYKLFDSFYDKSKSANTAKYLAENYLEIFANKVGIITSIGTQMKGGLIYNVYEFCHKSYQEYLTGLAISNGIGDENYNIDDIYSFLLLTSIDVNKYVDDESIRVKAFDKNLIESLMFSFSILDSNQLYISISNAINSIKNECSIIHYTSILDAICYSVSYLDKSEYSYKIFELIVNELLSIYEDIVDSSVNDEIDGILKKLSSSNWSVFLLDLLNTKFISDFKDNRIHTKIFNNMINNFDNLRIKRIEAKESTLFEDFDLLPNERYPDYCLDFAILGHANFTQSLNMPDHNLPTDEIVENIFKIIDLSDPAHEFIAAWSLCVVCRANDFPYMQYDKLTNILWQPNVEQIKYIEANFNRVRTSSGLKAFTLITAVYKKIKPPYDYIYAYFWAKKLKGEDVKYNDQELRSSLPEAFKAMLLKYVHNQNFALKIEALSLFPILSYSDEVVVNMILNNLHYFRKSFIFSYLVPYICFTSYTTIEHLHKLFKLLGSDKRINKVFAAITLIGLSDKRFLKFEKRVDEFDDSLTKSYFNSVIDVLRYNENKAMIPKGHKFIFYDIDDLILTKCSSSRLSYKVTGKDVTGGVAWYFVLIHPINLNEFLSKKEGSSYNLEDFGIVVRSGYGEKVPLDVQEELSELYNFDNF